MVSSQQGSWGELAQIPVAKILGLATLGDAYSVDKMELKLSILRKLGRENVSLSL